MGSVEHSGLANEQLWKYIKGSDEIDLDGNRQHYVYDAVIVKKNQETMYMYTLLPSIVK